MPIENQMYRQWLLDITSLGLFVFDLNPSQHWVLRYRGGK